MNKLLTVSIAAYNVQDYIEETLNSLIVNNRDELEVLVIIDGATDKTFEKAKKYEELYPEIFKVIQKENGGYGSTINVGIKNATGKFFKQLDGDDWFKTENLDEVLDILKNIDDVDIIYTPYIEYFEKSHEEKIIKDIEKFQECEIQNLEDKILDFNSSLVMHSLMFKTEILKKNNIKIDENCFYTDTEYAILPLKYCSSIAIIDKPLYVYRIGINGQSISYKSRIKNCANHELVSKRLINEIENINTKNSNLYKYLEEYVGKHLTATISNFLILQSSSKENFEKIKSYDKYIYHKNNRIYDNMEKYSKIIKLLRRNKYVFYIVCHYIRSFKFRFNLQ